MVLEPAYVDLALVEGGFLLGDEFLINLKKGILVVVHADKQVNLVFPARKKEGDAVAERLVVNYHECADVGCDDGII